MAFQIHFRWGVDEYDKIDKEAKNLINEKDIGDKGLMDKAKDIASISYHSREISKYMKQLQSNYTQAIIRYIHYNLNRGRVQFVSEDFAFEHREILRHHTVLPFSKLIVPFKDGKPQRELSYVLVGKDRYDFPQPLFLIDISDLALIHERELHGMEYVIFHGYALMPNPTKVALLKAIDF